MFIDARSHIVELSPRSSHLYPIRAWASFLRVVGEAAARRAVTPWGSWGVEGGSSSCYEKRFAHNNLPTHNISSNFLSGKAADYSSASRVLTFTCSAFYFSSLLFFMSSYNIISSGGFFFCVCVYVIFFSFFVLRAGVLGWAGKLLFCQGGDYDFFSVVHPWDFLQLYVCSCLSCDRCFRDRAVLAVPGNWVGFMFNCKIKVKEIKLAFISLHGKPGHSLPFLGFDLEKQCPYFFIIFLIIINNKQHTVSSFL